MEISSCCARLALHAPAPGRCSLAALSAPVRPSHLVTASNTVHADHWQDAITKEEFHPLGWSLLTHHDVPWIRLLCELYSAWT